MQVAKLDLKSFLMSIRFFLLKYLSANRAAAYTKRPPSSLKYFYVRCSQIVENISPILSFLVFYDFSSVQLMKDKLLNLLNTVLVADVFLVLISFLWLAIAVIGHSAGISLGLDLWYKLWEPLFTPAIGLLMAGALFSGITSWISRKLEVRQ